jgi:undecaprenyl-diphosphatase
MFAATAYSLILKKWGTGTEMKRGYELIIESKENTQAFIIGNIAAFIVALLAIKFFISFLKKYGFRVFGIYRIIVGGILLVLIAIGKL